MFYVDSRYITDLSVDDVLQSTDTIMLPLQLSLVNGNVKSENDFLENGRVKKMKVYVNDIFIANVILLDNPSIQKFELNAIFHKEDIIKLVPVECYPGKAHEEIYLSEIQSSLAHVTHASINEKYKVNDLPK